MFKWFSAWARGVITKMLHIDEAKRALKVDIAIGGGMRDAIDTWALMFQEKAPWLGGDTRSLGLPAAIAGEIARLVTVEMESAVTGSRRAEFLQGEYRRVLDRLRVSVEYAAASGGVAFKPYVDGGHIAVDCVPGWRFLPTAFNSLGEVTGAVFVEQVRKGKLHYTRMEHHQLAARGYTIRNLAFLSPTGASLGVQCGLAEVDEWAELEPELVIRQKNGEPPDGVLFSYFKLPFANTVDSDTPLGVSVYSRAVGLIEQADRQYSRILWEYEGSELAIDASEEALRPGPGGGPSVLPERHKRLFRRLGIDQGSRGDLYQVFSPAIRDASLFHGLDKILKRIEFNCYLSYGTLSDPQSVDKTAEEVKTSKQRSFSAVRDIQKSLQSALEHLVWIMDQYATMYGLAPGGAYGTSFTWGDGIMEDTAAEYARRRQLANDGYLRPEKLIAWCFGVTEEEARKEYMPPAAPPMFRED